MSGHHPFDALEGHRYVALTTFRRSGEGVTTPVWFARLEDVLFIFTGLDSGKVKRIRNNSRVTLAPSNVRGRPKGVSFEAEARLMSEAEEGVADRTIEEKYTWQYRLFNTMLGLRRNPAKHIFMELRTIPDERETG